MADFIISSPLLIYVVFGMHNRGGFTFFYAITSIPSQNDQFLPASLPKKGLLIEFSDIAAVVDLSDVVQIPQR
jgi:hypothetical protein